MYTFILLFCLTTPSVFALECGECEETVKNFAGVSKCVRKPDCCPAGVDTINCFIDPCKTSRRAYYKCVSIYCANSPCSFYEYDKNLDVINY